MTIPIFFEVEALNHKTIPYQRDKNKEANKLLQILNITPHEEDGKYVFDSKSVISHEPTKLNYWHVEFQLKDIEDNLISNTKSAWKKNAEIMALKHVISSNASLDCREIIPIPKNYFNKH